MGGVDHRPLGGLQQPVETPGAQGDVEDRDGRLGDPVGQGAEALAPTGGEQDGVDGHRLVVRQKDH